MKTPRTALLFAVAAAALIGLSLLSRVQISPTDGAPPEKQTFEARLQQTEVAGVLTQNAYMQMGTTGPEPAGVDPHASCPGPTERTTGIWPRGIRTPIYGTAVINFAVAKGSTGQYYVVYAGGPASHHFPTPAVGEVEPGVLLVAPIEPDPCAAAAKGQLAQVFLPYETPRGPLTILKIDGDVAIYGIEGGGTGRFNYVKGEFLP